VTLAGMNVPRPLIRASAVLAAVALLCTACGHEPGSSGNPTQTFRPPGGVHRVAPAGLVGGGPSLLDLNDPQIANLDPRLRDALEHAARDARVAGVPLKVTSGWRSWAHQQRLLDDAIAKYGSLQQALRYVSPPDRSKHVTGDAVDIGPDSADRWLEQHGSAYGLCRVFANERWHFELLAEPGGSCPALLPDATYR